MQKLFIDYLDEAQQRQAAVKKPNGRNASSSSASSIDAIKRTTEAVTAQIKPQRKMKKLFIEYLDEAQAKVEAQKKNGSK